MVQAMQVSDQGLSGTAIRTTSHNPSTGFSSSPVMSVANSGGDNLGLPLRKRKDDDEEEEEEESRYSSRRRKTRRRGPTVEDVSEDEEVDYYEKAVEEEPEEKEQEADESLKTDSSTTNIPVNRGPSNCAKDTQKISEIHFDAKLDEKNGHGGDEVEKKCDSENEDENNKFGGENKDENNENGGENIDGIKVSLPSHHEHTTSTYSREELVDSLAWRFNSEFLDPKCARYCATDIIGVSCLTGQHFVTMTAEAAMNNPVCSLCLEGCVTIGFLKKRVKETLGLDVLIGPAWAHAYGVVDYDQDEDIEDVIYSCYKRERELDEERIRLEQIASSENVNWSLVLESNVFTPDIASNARISCGIKAFYNPSEREKRFSGEEGDVDIASKNGHNASKNGRFASKNGTNGANFASFNKAPKRTSSSQSQKDCSSQKSTRKADLCSLGSILTKENLAGGSIFKQPFPAPLSYTNYDSIEFRRAENQEEISTHSYNDRTERRKAFKTSSAPVLGKQIITSSNADLSDSFDYLNSTECFDPGEFYESDDRLPSKMSSMFSGSEAAFGDENASYQYTDDASNEMEDTEEASDDREDEMSMDAREERIGEFDDMTELDIKFLEETVTSNGRRNVHRQFTSPSDDRIEQNGTQNFESSNSVHGEPPVSKSSENDYRNDESQQHRYYEACADLGMLETQDLEYARVFKIRVPQEIIEAHFLRSSRIENFRNMETFDNAVLKVLKGAGGKELNLTQILRRVPAAFSPSLDLLKDTLYRLVTSHYVRKVHDERGESFAAFLRFSFDYELLSSTQIITLECEAGHKWMTNLRCILQMVRRTEEMRQNAAEMQRAGASAPIHHVCSLDEFKARNTTFRSHLSANNAGNGPTTPLQERTDEAKFFGPAHHPPSECGSLKTGSNSYAGVTSFTGGNSTAGQGNSLPKETTRVVKFLSLPKPRSSEISSCPVCNRTSHLMSIVWSWNKEKLLAFARKTRLAFAGFSDDYRKVKFMCFGATSPHETKLHYTQIIDGCNICTRRRPKRSREVRPD